MLAPDARGGDPAARLLVLLVDRHALFLAALRKVLEDRRHAHVEVTTSSEAALAILSGQQVDLIISELQAEPIGGPDLVARAMQLSPSTRSILLADPEDAPSLVAALSSGAAGFFTKDATPEEFLDGIDAVLAGHFVVGRNLLRSRIDDVVEPAATGPAPDEHHLSPSEQVVLGLIGMGKSIHEIAVSRQITEKTVRNHLANIYRKLALGNRADAILYSARMRRADPSPPERP